MAPPPASGSPATTDLAPPSTSGFWPAPRGAEDGRPLATGAGMRFVRARDGGAPGPAVSLLDVDPDLGARLDAHRGWQAQRALRARELSWQRRGEPAGLERRRSGLGLLIVDGILLRRTRVGCRCVAELLGSGDLLRDEGDPGSDPESPGATVELHVIRPLRLLDLDLSFVARAAPWPEVLDELAGRWVARAHRLAEQLAITQLTTVDDRLCRTLWRLAERYGRVTPDGVVVPLPLTHEQLGWLVGTRRPSVTTSLGRLASRNLVRRLRAGWLLTGKPPEEPVASPAPIA